MIAESCLEFRHVGLDELGIFLALTATTVELQEHNLRQYCPTRPKKGRVTTLASSGTCKNESKRWSEWIGSKEKPNNEAYTRLMLAFAVGKNLKVNLESHMFRFNNKYYKQMMGVAIGVG